MSSANPDPVRSANPRPVRDVSRRDDDAATVIAILTAIAAASYESVPEPVDRSVWADPAHRLGLSSASPTGWWASGLPR